MIAIFCFLLVVGGVGIPETPSTAEGWTAGTFVLLISTAYAFSIGPVVYNLVGEIPSTRLRAKSVVLARNAYNVANVSFVSIVTYRQLDKNSWNWGSKAGFFWAGTNLLCTIYLYFRLRKLFALLVISSDFSTAETKGRTYADLDILFENKVPARKFASTKIGMSLEQFYSRCSHMYRVSDRRNRGGCLKIFISIIYFVTHSLIFVCILRWNVRQISRWQIRDALFQRHRPQPTGAKTGGKKVEGLLYAPTNLRSIW